MFGGCHLILLASLLAVMYLQVVEVAYFQEPEGDTSVSEAPLTMLIPTYALVLASVYFGIFTSPMLSAAREAAEMFLKAGGV